MNIHYQLLDGSVEKKTVLAKNMKGPLLFWKMCLKKDLNLFGGETKANHIAPDRIIFLHCRKTKNLMMKAIQYDGANIKVRGLFPCHGVCSFLVSIEGAIIKNR